MELFKFRSQPSAGDWLEVEWPATSLTAWGKALCVKDPFQGHDFDNYNLLAGY